MLSVPDTQASPSASEQLNSQLGAAEIDTHLEDRDRQSAAFTNKGSRVSYDVQYAGNDEDEGKTEAGEKTDYLERRKLTIREF